MNRGSTADVTESVLLTPAGRGAVATILVEGPSSVAIVERLLVRPGRRRPFHEQPIGSLLLGRWATDDGEEVVVVRAGAEQVEVHCHGGLAASRAILAGLREAGCHERAGDEWLAGQAESATRSVALEQLTQARSLRTAEILLDQYQGGFDRRLDEIDARVERGEVDDARRMLQRLAVLAPVGLHLVQPWRVCLAGAPNVGKSSLINRLVGFDRAIVIDQPGTTRDALRVDTALDGWPVRLSDSAGLRDSQDPLETAGIARAKHEIELADLIVWVCDASAPDATLSEPPDGIRCTVLRVANKADLASAVPPAGCLATSAATGAGVEQLATSIVERLVPAAPKPGEAVPTTTEQVAAVEARLRRLDSR